MADRKAAAVKEEPAVEEAPAGDEPAAWEGTVSASEPIVAPDGHVTLSQEDIDARDQ